MSVTVYSKPNCPQCNATYRKMNQLGIDHSVIDISRDADALAYVVGMGYNQAPVVVSGDRSWSGYVPEKIMSLI